MLLHIFLGDEELLYFMVRVEVTKIQIWFEYKLVCNLQKGLKIYKGFSIFLALWAETHWRPNRPPPTHSPIGPASQRRWPIQPSGRAPVLCSPIRPIKRGSDPISLQPDPNLLSYPLSCSFKPILFPFRFILNLREIEFDSKSESVRIFAFYDLVQKLYI
jgi:hypothetical protein